MKKKMELKKLNRQRYINASENIKKGKKTIVKTEVFWMMQMYIGEVMPVKLDILAM